jgi:hypothetical protein
LDATSFQGFPQKEDSGSHLGIAPAEFAILNIICQKDMTKSQFQSLQWFCWAIVHVRNSQELRDSQDLGTPNSLLIKDLLIKTTWILAGCMHFH